MDGVELSLRALRTEYEHLDHQATCSRVKP